MRPSNDSTADLWALGAALGRMQAASYGLAALAEPDPASPLGRRHGYDLARLAWDDARRTCVECGADCGVSVDHCGRCGYPVCRQCGPLLDVDGEIVTRCRGCQ